jgi:hypothetical protein
MTRKIFAAVLSLVLLTACNLPGASNISGPTLDPAAATAAQETQVAGAVASALAAGVTDTLSFTLTASETPSLTPTFTLEIPRVSVSVDTNCRSGPGTVYDSLGALTVGQTAEVVGKSANADNWIIRLPSNPAITCWLWAQYATVTGDTSNLPIIQPPPTPTPEVTFTISYLSTVPCAGLFGFRFQLTNTGSMTWESYKVDVTDSTISVTKTYTSDAFLDSTPACVATTTLQDLTPGEIGVTGNWYTGLLNSNPAGHNITATFTLCSQNGLAGTCISKSISFTP